MAVGQEPERTRKRAPRATGNGVRAEGAAQQDREITTRELEQLLHALEAARDGNFSLRLPAAGTGIAAEIRRAFNELADRREALGKEIDRVGRAVGREGRLTERAVALGDGGWSRTASTRFSTAR